MKGFDVDEYIKKRRKKENLFGIKKDSKTGRYVSFPLVDEETEENIKEEYVEKREIESDIEDELEEELPTICINYDKEEIKNHIICKWNIELAYGMDWDIPKNISEWVDSKVELKDSAKAHLYRANSSETPPILNLVIGGRGEDNRCRWCHSFWTAIVNRGEKSSFEVDKESSCIFDI